MDVLSADFARYSAAQVRLELPKGNPNEQLRAVATEFEALFAKQMLDSMRSTLNSENDMFHGGMAQDIFEDMLYEEYSRVMAKTGSLGIADIIYSQYQNSV